MQFNVYLRREVKELVFLVKHPLHNALKSAKSWYTVDGMV